MTDIDNTNTIFFLCSKNRKKSTVLNSAHDIIIIGFGMEQSSQPHHIEDNLGQEILVKLGRPISERHSFVAFD